MSSKAGLECDEDVDAPTIEQEGGKVEDDGNLEPDLSAIAQALTWEGYGSLDAVGRRKVIGQLWTLYNRRRLASSGCQVDPTGE